MVDRVSLSHRIKSYSSDAEIAAYQELENHLRSPAMRRGELLAHLGLFLTRASLARMLFMHDLYLKILNVPGCLMEFGCQYGQNLALFSSFRSIYEPQNIGRTIVGFDRFDGLITPSLNDGAAVIERAGEKIGATRDGYEETLDRILTCHNALGPRAHLKKHEVVKGDVAVTLPAYLDHNPETLIALAYLDLGAYEPTHKCLQLVMDRMPKGGVIGLDHLAMRDLPGDSIAVKEMLGYRNSRFVRDPRVPFQSYVVLE